MPEGDNFYKDILDNLFDGVYFVDRKRVVTYWNKGAERITGYKDSQVIGRSCRDNLLNHVTADGMQLCLSHCPLAACMEDGNICEVEVFLHHADGHRVPVLVRAAPLYDDQGNIVGAVETFMRDTGGNTLHQQLRELRHLSHTDLLTNLGNRQYLEGRLQAVIAEYKNQESGVGLMFMDIDHFKRINDTYGHERGDKTLRMVATTLKQNLRKTDVIGRWGGDEFLAILYKVRSFDILKTIGEKLCTLVSLSHLDLANQSLQGTISIGGTLLRQDDTPESFVCRADELMYQSKLAGRNRVSVG